MRSPVPALKLAPRPIDKRSARVAFFQGDHFQPAKPADGSRRTTWRVMPPVIGQMPSGEQDFAGMRNGRMTAVCWYRPQKKASIWLCRCDCGNFEARRPGMWDADLPSRWGGNDACTACRNTDAAIGRAPKRSRETTSLRRDRWIAGLLALGLSVHEIAAVMQGNTETHGLSAEQIRQQLAGGAT